MICAQQKFNFCCFSNTVAKMCGGTFLEYCLVGNGREAFFKTEILSNFTMAVSNIEECVWAYEGRIQLLRAAAEENINRVVKKRDSSERTALHWACVSGKVDVVDFLITNGAEVCMSLD